MPTSGPDAWRHKCLGVECRNCKNLIGKIDDFANSACLERMDRQSQREAGTRTVEIYASNSKRLFLNWFLESSQDVIEVAKMNSSVQLAA